MNDPIISFDPILDYLFIWTMSAALLITLAWLEVKRQQRFIVLRSFAVFIVVLSIAGLLLRPRIDKEKKSARILLTEGFHPAKVDSLVSRLDHSELLLAPGLPRHKNIEPLKSWNDLNGQEIAYVVGGGLPPSGIEAIESSSFKFLSTEPTRGILNLNYPEIAYINRASIVSGAIDVDQRTKLFLSGPGGVEDSVLIEKGENKFQLKLFPKTAGLFLYHITDGKNLRENVPFQIADVPALKILFIQRYPTFEAQQLKTFLSAKNELVLRYQLSKSTYRYEFVNHKPIKASTLTQSLFESFDLLIIDSDELKGLTKSEKSNIESAVHNGMGVLTLYNENPMVLKSLRSFVPSKLTSYLYDTAHMALDGKNVVIPAWPVHIPLSPEVTATVRTKTRALSGYQFNGRGKIGFQLLQSTYQLALKGDTASYRQLWSSLITKVSKAKKEKFTISLSTPAPYLQNEPLQVQVLSEEESPVLYYKSNRIPLKEDLYIDNLWKGRFWPDKSGWDTLLIHNDSSRFYFYINENESGWLKRKFFEQTSMIASTDKGAQKLTKSNEPLPPWIFFVFFLVASSALWLLPKI